MEIPAAVGWRMGKTWESGCHGANRARQLQHPMNPMKDMLLSILRHSMTGLAGLGGFLVSKNLADAGDAPALDAAGATLADTLAVVLAVVLARLVIFLVGKLGGSSSSAGAAGTVLVIGLAGVLGFLLPACSPAQLDAVKQTPVKVCYVDEDGNQVCYSTKDGVSATVDRRSRK